MEEDDDDFYGNEAQYADDGQQNEEADMAIDPAEDEDEDDDSDDDVKFTLEKPEGSKEESAAPARKQTTSVEPAFDRQSKAPPTSRQDSQARTSSTAPAPIVKATIQNGKEGKDYPEIRTSKIDINAIPTWPGTGKPITEIDIDADLAEQSKAWRQPGVDQTDFFNYGFDEYTWAQYCVRQQTMSNSISEAKQADADMKAFLGGGGAGAAGGGAGGGGPAGGMPGMPGMGEMDPAMAQMMQQMAGNGMPNFDQFMQMMGGQGGGGGGGGFGGGFGQGTGSPLPQPGQGFQPPGGPGVGMGDNMDGFSNQQIGIMQQQGGMGNQGGGGRRGRGRGRGYY